MSRQWRELRRCRSRHDAELLRTALIDRGVEAIVPDAHVMGVQPMCSKGASDVRLLVPQDQIELACEILGHMSADRSNVP